MSDFTRNPEFDNGHDFDLKNVKVKWAHVQSPDTKFEHAWKIDAVLDKAEAESLKAVGFGVKESDDGEFTLTLKTKCKTKAGKENRPPLIVGRDGRTPFTDEIGNGSICNIKGYAKYTEVSGNTYLPAYLNAVQVVDHVARGAGFDDVDAE